MNVIHGLEPIVRYGLPLVILCALFWLSLPINDTHKPQFGITIFLSVGWAFIYALLFPMGIAGP